MQISRASLCLYIVYYLCYQFSIKFTMYKLTLYLTIFGSILCPCDIDGHFCYLEESVLIQAIVALLITYTFMDMKKENFRQTYKDSASYYYFIVPFANNPAEDVEYPWYMEYVAPQHIDRMHEDLTDWYFDDNRSPIVFDTVC